MRPSGFKTLLLAAIVAAAWSVPGGAQDAGLLAPRAQVCDDPTESTTLFAKRIRPGRIGYGLTPQSVSIPGPRSS